MTPEIVSEGFVQRGVAQASIDGVILGAQVGFAAQVVAAGLVENKRLFQQAHIFGDGVVSCACALVFQRIGDVVNGNAVAGFAQ